jgi:hypothetical protein
MDSEREKSFDELLWIASLKTPPSDLTDKIMRQIDVEVARQMVLEPGLKKLIRLHSLKTPPARLTRRIAFEITPVHTHAPIISSRILYAFLICIVLLLISGNYLFPAQTSSQPTHVSMWAEVFYKLTSLTSSIPLKYLAGLVTLCALLTIDFLLRHKSKDRVATN